MEITIHLPTKRAVAPGPITTLTPGGDTVLIELQGSLEIDDVPTDGAVLGQLTFETGREVRPRPHPSSPSATNPLPRSHAQEKPTLTVSHHRLEGRIVPLHRPLAVLQHLPSPSPSLSPGQTEYKVTTVLRRKIVFSKRPEPIV